MTSPGIADGPRPLPLWSGCRRASGRRALGMWSFQNGIFSCFCAPLRGPVVLRAPCLASASPPLASPAKVYLISLKSPERILDTSTDTEVITFALFFSFFFRGKIDLSALLSTLLCLWSSMFASDVSSKSHVSSGFPSWGCGSRRRAIE